ncbi:MAG: hypothetical protein RL204_1654 [Bacteroidota bacterium]
MKTLINLTLTCLLILLGMYSKAQDANANDIKWKTNSIYGNLGIGGLYLTATGYYERIIFKPFEKRNISPLVKVGYGGYAEWAGRGDYFVARTGILTGIKKHHFETSIGITYYYKYDMVWPSILAGYRIQKPNSPFLFRTGIGFPEALYVGIGLSF